MRRKTKYLVVIVTLAVLAVVFGLAGMFAPLSSSSSTSSSSSSSDSFTRFASTQATYDSGWVDITDKAGEYIPLTHGLNTTDVVVDITGKRSLDPEGGALAWSRTYGGANDDYAYSVVQTVDGGYALAGYTNSFGAGSYDSWLVKINSAGNLQWNKTYGGASTDTVNSVVQTSDGGYALVGATYSFGAGGQDFWLVKTDSAGNIMWNKTYGGANTDLAYSMVQTTDGGYALAGAKFYSVFPPTFDFWLVKTDSNGNHQWNKTFGGSGPGRNAAYSVVQTGDGGYALAGYTGSFGAGASDFWLVKTDVAGNVLWNQTYGGTSDDVAYSMVQTSDGGYALAGYTFSFGAGGQDFWLVKTDANGNMVWNQTYGGANTDYGQSVIQTGDGGYALTGHTGSFGAGGYDFWLVKTDSVGTMLWNQTYGGGTGHDRGKSVIQTFDGGYALAGYTESYGVGGADFWLVKVNPVIRRIPAIHRSPEWSRTYGGANTDLAYSMVQTTDGGYALAGETYSFGAGGNDFWLVKTDSAGNHVWSQTYGGASNDSAKSVVQTSDGGYAIAGFTNSSGAGSYDFWLVKTDSAGNIMWNKTYGGASSDYAYSVVQTVDGGYAIAGSTDFFGDTDFWLVKTDSVGTMLWSQTYGGTDEDVATSVVQTSDGGYAIAGYTNSFGAGLADFWLVKTDSAGNAVWGQTYGGVYNDRAYSVVQTSDGGYAIAGYNGYYFSIDPPIFHFPRFWLVKTDSAGNWQWDRGYGGVYNDGAYSVVQTSDGGYALAGHTFSFGAGGNDFWLVKTDSAGNIMWNKTYGGANTDLAYSMVQTVDGGYALAGYTLSYGAGGKDFWLVKTEVETGLAWTGLTNYDIILYRGRTDPYWNYVRVRIWTIEEPTWQFGDINQDGAVDAMDLYILSQNYGKSFSLLSLGGIVAVGGIYTYNTRKEQKRWRDENE